MTPLSDGGEPAHDQSHSLDFHRLVLEVAGAAALRRAARLPAARRRRRGRVPGAARRRHGRLADGREPDVRDDRSAVGSHAGTEDRGGPVARLRAGARRGRARGSALRQPLHRLATSCSSTVIAAAHPDAPNPPTPPRDFHGVFETLHKFGLAWNGPRPGPEHLAFVLDRGPRLGWTDIAALPVAPQATADFERLAAARRRGGAADIGLHRRPVAVRPDAGGRRRTWRIRRRSSPMTFSRRSASGPAGRSADVTYLTGPSGFNLPAAGGDAGRAPVRRPADAPSTPIRRSGVSAEQAHAWTVAEPTFAEAQSIKQALTLSYEPDEWLTVLGAIQDELRPLRRDALLGYLLHTLGFEDSTAFYHHYLIDPDRAPCARTSRIVEAHRRRADVRAAHPVRPRAVHVRQEDAEAWQWRKNYRVWEAARKVFLFPENWIEPELRDNKSVVLQGARRRPVAGRHHLRTPRSACIREYLHKLDQVSRLEIMGMYEDTWGERRRRRSTSCTSSAARETCRTSTTTAAARIRRAGRRGSRSRWTSRATT